MTLIKRTCLLAGASALALGLSAEGAKAFNEVNWTWNAHVFELILKKIKIDVDFDPSGVVMVEAFQKSIGDITATSIVYDVHNNPPGGGNGGGEVTIDLGALDWSHSRQGDTNSAIVDYVFDDTQGGVVSYDPNLTGFQSIVDGEEFDAGGTAPLGTITVSVEPGDPGDPLDALTELPEVVSAATAVGNNLAIDSATMVEFHVGQTTVGDGWFQAANIDANSLVWGVTNATVDSTATAVGNNFSVNLEACGGCDDPVGNDLIVIGDLSQFSHANVTAYSQVNDIGISNYTNLGAIDRPIVSSVATAVGNNASISVGFGE